MNDVGVVVKLIDSYSEAHGFREERQAPADHPDSASTRRQVEDAAKSEGAVIEHIREAKEERLPKNAAHFDLASATSIVETSLLAFASSGAALALFKASKTFLLKWLDISSRHKIVVSVGDIKIEVTGQETLEQVIAAIERILATPKPKSSIQKSKSSLNGKNKP